MLPAHLEESGRIQRLLRGRNRLVFGLVATLCIGLIAGCGGGERQDEDEPEGEFPVEVVKAEFPPEQRLAETSELTLTVANVGDAQIPDLAITVWTVADPEAGEAALEDAAEAEAAEDADTGGLDDTPTTDGSEAGGETATDASGEEISEEELGAAVDQALEEELEEQGAETTGEDSEEPTEDAGTTPDTEEEDFPQADGAFSVLSEQEGLASSSRPVWILEQGFPRVAGTEAGPAPPGEISGAGGAEAVQTNTFSFGPLDADQIREVVWLVTPVQAGAYTVHYRIAAGLGGKAIAVGEDGSVPEGEFAVLISREPPQTRVDDEGNVVEIEEDDIVGAAGSEEQKSEIGGGK